MPYDIRLCMQSMRVSCNTVKIIRDDMHALIFMISYLQLLFKSNNFYLKNTAL